MIKRGVDGRIGDGRERPGGTLPIPPDEDELARALLERLNRGDTEARDELFELMISDLRHVAKGLMSGQSPAHTLQATAVVNEAYLRLYGGPPRTFKDRAHFLHAAAKAMRWVLVDHARAKATRRRASMGDTVELVSSHGVADPEPALAVLEFDEELEKLARVKPDMARAISMRTLLGVPMTEIAKVLRIPMRTFERDYKAAAALITSQLEKR